MLLPLKINALPFGVLYLPSAKRNAAAEFTAALKIDPALEEAKKALKRLK